MLADIWRPVRSAALMLLLLFSLALAVIREDVPMILGAGFLLVVEAVHYAACEITSAIREQPPT